MVSWIDYWNKGESQNHDALIYSVVPSALAGMLNSISLLDWQRPSGSGGSTLHYCRQNSSLPCLAELQELQEYACWERKLCDSEKLVRNVGSNPSLSHKAVYNSVGECNAHVRHCAEPFHNGYWHKEWALGTECEMSGRHCEGITVYNIGATPYEPREIPLQSTHKAITW